MASRPKNRLHGKETFRKEKAKREREGGRERERGARERERMNE